MKSKEIREKMVTTELKKYKEVFDRVLDVIESSQNNLLGDVTISGKEKFSALKI